MAEEKPAVPTKVSKIIVGYKTRIVEGIDGMVPTYEPPKNYKDPVKRKAYVDEKIEGFKLFAAETPYTATFDEVHIVDSFKQKIVQFSHKHSAEDGRASVATRVLNFLTKNYAGAWTDDTHNRKKPTAIFVGFEIRTFLKILGIECSMPGAPKRCPLGLWYDNSEHRDIGHAIIPTECKHLTLPQVLKYRRPSGAALAAAWDEWLAGWTGPCIQPAIDVRICAELCQQLGFME